MSYQFSQEAVKRISALGQALVTEFIEEIPQSLRKAVYKYLPRVPGFRDDSPAEFKEKQRRLIGHLIHPNTSPKGAFDWVAFANLWEAWAKERLGETFPQGDNAVPSFDAAPAFLKKLAELFPNASREDMERLFVFSGFPDHPDVTAALTLFSPASALARDQMIDKLSALLGKIENRLDAVENTAVDMDKQIRLIRGDSDSFYTRLEKTAKSTQQNLKEIVVLREERDVESTRYDTIERAVNELDIAVKKFTGAMADLNFRFVELEQRILAVDAYKAYWTETVESFGVLAERVTALERILVEGGSGTRQRIRMHDNKQEGPFFDILSVEDACAVVASNLQAVGIVKGAAIATARQIVATFIAGQIVQFSGSLADLAADAVAAAVGGPVYHECRVPVGLVSGEAASYCIGRVSESSGCLVLKGANLSAFEVYGASVRDIVVCRQLTTSVYGRLALIASWTHGPAAFPHGGMLAELGPVFDTDSLPMRGVLATRPQLRFGRLIKDTWGQIEGLEIDEYTPSADEFRELLTEADFKGSSLWWRMVHHVYVILGTIPGGTQIDDLYSLLVKWAVPWAKAIDGPAEKLAHIAERELAARRTETVD